MSGENNGQSRLDRLESLMQLLIDDHHLKFTDEHKLLLRAQVILTEAQERTERTMQEFAEGLIELKEAQQHTDERLNTLINIVDDLIRKRPDA